MKPEENTPEYIEELNDNGEVVSLYHTLDEGGGFKVVRRSSKFSTLPKKILDAFLPVGYPNSVSEDYLEYQIYDSLQAFSSSMAGLLSSRAVLQGFGVGDANASATNALLLSILQESVGRIATILFAFRFGVALEHECKKYRLMADFFNDGAFILDCASPALPSYLRVACLCLSGSLRALCGIAAGGAKATLSNHFATYGNVGDLCAKDSSQETIISLAGMLVGSALVSSITSPTATWIALLSLLIIHLWTNFKAVSAVRLRTLNRQRATLVVTEFLDSGKVLTPHAVSVRESIFARGSIVRNHEGSRIGFVKLGPRLSSTTALRSESYRRLFREISLLFTTERYILWLDDVGSQEVCLLLKEGATADDKLKAWTHAVFFLDCLKRFPRRPLDGDVVDLVKQSQAMVAGCQKPLLDGLQQAKWDTTISGLVAGPSYCMRMVNEKKSQ